MIKRCISLVFALTLLWPGGLQAGFKEGVQHYEKEEFDRSIAEFRALADLTHIRSMFNLGVFYDLGLGIDEDPYKAAYWYAQAAERGDPRAQYNLGLVHMQGKGVAQSYTEAEKWFLRAALQDHAQAQHNLGIMYYEGLGRVEHNYEKGMQWLHRAKINGFRKGRNDLNAFGLTVSQAEIYTESGWKGLVFPLTRND